MSTTHFQNPSSPGAIHGARTTVGLCTLGAPDHANVKWGIPTNCRTPAPRAPHAACSDVVTGGVPAPLTVICPDCGGEGSRYTSRYGGNDPDVWRTGPCFRCEQTGYAVLRCNHCDDAEAVEWFMSDALCAACAGAEKENAFYVGEDVA